MRYNCLNLAHALKMSKKRNMADQIYMKRIAFSTKINNFNFSILNQLSLRVMS